MRWLALLWIAGTLTACQTPARFQAPEGYVVMNPDWDAAFSAVASSGNRYDVRVHDNPAGGTLDFWSEAIQRELVQARGYELSQSRPLVDAMGRDGRELLFTVAHEQERFLYLVTVFVEPKLVTVMEAGGEAEALEADLEALRKAMAR